MKYDSFKEFEAEVLAEHGEYGLRDQWVVGGQSGGSCWDEGESSYSSIDTEDEPDQKILDAILDDAFADLTFREYRILQKAEVMRYERESQNEYYGNYTEYRVRTLDLRKLYDTLHDIQGEREQAAERKAAGLD